MEARASIILMDDSEIHRRSTLLLQDATLLPLLQTLPQFEAACAKGNAQGQSMFEEGRSNNER